MQFASSVPPVAIAGTPSASGGSSSARPDPAALAPGVTVSHVQTADRSVVTVAVIRGLRTGLGTVVIDRSGHARVGVWGPGLPVPGEAVYSARQNLGPLLIDGRLAANVALWHQWGGTLAHAEYVARGALGQDSAGDLLYAASMSTIPADLAGALARHGARSAMELDINPAWVQLDTARSPGGPLTAAVLGQVRPASQYLTGWTRDFIAVVIPAAK
jgi:hypothetical protein